MKALRAVLILSASCLLLCGLAAGQAVYGNIIGTVHDPSGAAVPNAAVSITDTDRGIASETSTNASGNYEQTHLLAGHYRVKVTAPGFSPSEIKADVQIDASTRVDVQLGVQATSSEVTVTAETPLLKTDRADVSTTLSTNELGTLPTLNRNLTQLLLITPGTQLNDFQHASSENPQGGYQIAVNGQQFTSNGFLLDGTENNSAILGIAVINPNIDSLQEFKVTTSNYDAQFGSVSGALLQATTKSGTNNFHGSAFEYLRNDIFNASDHFSGLTLPLRWNEFGGSIGGPIKKDKIFFFGDYQGTRRRRAASVVTTVPTAAERAGDLRGLLGDFICSDGSTSPSGCANPFLVTTTENTQVPAQAGMVFDPTTGNPDGTGRQAISTNGQVNVLPAVPVAVTNILKFIPGPNTAGAAIANNYIATGSEKFNSDQFDTRIDYDFSQQMHIFGRYTLADFDKAAPGAFGAEAGGPALVGINFAGTSLARNQSLALASTYSLSNTLITDFRFGFYRYRVRVQPNGIGTTPATDAGFPGLNLGTTETSGMPAFYINGNGGFDFGYALGVNQCNCPLKETENHFQWVNNWTKTKGNHTIGWGADIRRAQQQRVPSDSHRSGEITFTSGVTGNADADSKANGVVTTGSALASFLLAQPSTFARYFTGIGFHPGLRQTRLFFYAQDSWRVTPKLTINYGLRYENYLPQTAASPGGAGSFDTNTGEVLVAGVGSVPLNMGVKAYNQGFAPRLGFAYQVTQRTVVRAGYGRSFTPAGLGAVFGQAPDYDPPITNPQFNGQSNSYAPVFNLLSGPPTVANPPIGSNGRYPLPNGLSVFYFFNPPSAYRIPLADSWNLTIQHEFTPTLTGEIAYVGNVGRHLFINPNVNQAALDPNCVTDGTCNNFDARRLYFQKFALEQPLYEICNCDNSSYHAMQVKVQKRATRGLDFLVTYTYGKAMANSEDGGAFSDNLNWWRDHGPANYDRTHTLSISHIWRLPYGRGQHWGASISKPLDLILGGWQFSGISIFESGLPFTAQVGNAPLGFADLSSYRADQIGDPSVPHPNANLWFNPAAFTTPQGVGRNGDVRHNSLRGPEFDELDLALGKAFTLAEGKSLEFKWEVYNALNNVNLANPNNFIDEAGAGQIVSAGSMRQMQFGLHFRF
jgi:Carboxypeptidase regulatory-like domain/TonB dependent receptor